MRQLLLNGEVNSQNVRRCAPRGERPDVNYVNNSQARMTVWAGICGNGRFLGLFFLKENVNGARYLQILNEDVFPELVHIFADQLLNGHFTRLWCAQRRAPHHSAEVRG